MDERGGKDAPAKALSATTLRLNLCYSRVVSETRRCTATGAAPTIQRLHKHIPACNTRKPQRSPAQQGNTYGKVQRHILASTPITLGSCILLLCQTHANYSKYGISNCPSIMGTTSRRTSQLAWWVPAQISFIRHDSTMPCPPLGQLFAS